MAKVASNIRKFVSALAPGQLVCTFEVVAACPSLNSRGAVDSALSDLCKKGALVRVASGVFAAPQYPPLQFSDFDIARAKARISRSDLVLLPDASVQPNSQLLPSSLLPNSVLQPSSALAFSSNSRIMFKNNGNEIIVRKISGRKLALARTVVGKEALLLWLEGTGSASVERIKLVVERFNHNQLEEFITLSPLMPQWLVERAKLAVGPLWEKISLVVNQKSRNLPAKVLIDNSSIKSR